MIFIIEDAPLIKLPPLFRYNAPRRPYRLLYFLLMVYVVASSICEQDDSTETQGEAPFEDRFIFRFREGRYADALRVIDSRPDDSSAGDLKRVYRACCLSKLKRHREAANDFGNALLSRLDELNDPFVLSMAAETLFEIKAYSRAREMIDRLSALYPSSRIGVKLQPLAMKIEQAIERGIETDNLNWYFTEALRARKDDETGLASEYFKEFLTLANRLDNVNSDQLATARMHYGSLLLDHDWYEAAFTEFDAIPVSLDNYTAGLFKAMTLKLLDEDEKAFAIIDEIIANATGKSKTRAINLKEKWSQ